MDRYPLRLSVFETAAADTNLFGTSHGRGAFVAFCADTKRCGKLALVALRLLPRIQSQLTSAPDLWTFSDDAKCNLSSVDQTIVAEVSSKLLGVVHTKIWNTPKLLTTALSPGKTCMRNVIGMASDALSEDATKDAKNPTNLFFDLMSLSSHGETHMDQRLPTLVVHTKPNFCPCSHPYLSFAATRGPRSRLDSHGYQQSRLDEPISAIPLTTSKASSTSET